MKNLSVIALAVWIPLVLHAGISAQSLSTDLPFVHPLFSGNMVIQRGTPVPVWGWVEPGEMVTVSMLGQKSRATADANGKWIARIGPFEAGGPYTLEIKGPGSVIFDNVLVGDVWIASGQSNMEMGIKQVNDAENEIASADNPQIRLFTVPKVIDSKPLKTVQGRWLNCTPGNIASGGWGGFSAVAYFFGRKLEKELGIPIGLIHSSWGGTVAESWVSAGSLSELPEFRAQVANLDRGIADLEKGPPNIDEAMLDWWAENDPPSGPSSAWHEPGFDDSRWPKMRLPAYWEDAGLENFNGIVRFRYVFELPDEWHGRDLELSLGPIDDVDTTYVNGSPVGSTNRWDAPRNYWISAKLLRRGRNTIAIRVLDTGEGGGIYGNADQMFIRPSGGNGKPLPLAGEWRFREAAPLAKLKSPPQFGNSSFRLVNARYNAMIHPLFPFSIKGAIWYQGESNVGRAEQYEKIMSLLIDDWREGFESGEFPFLIVQLANYLKRSDIPADSEWARLREAQFNVSRIVPYSGLAVTIDIGEADDVHPRNKQDVGLRLALIALAKTYGKEVEFYGPVFRSMNVDGGKIRLSFDHANGLMTPGGAPLKGFELAGSDKKFYRAEARIECDQVVVFSPNVRVPVAVRYAWADNPEAGLYNAAGLPAAPFRTDDW